MRHCIALTLVALVVVAAASASAEHGPLLVEPDWLSERLDARDVRIVDLSDARAYRAGHVPGAVHLPVDDAYLTGRDDGTRLVRRLGLGPDTTVVAYDDAGGAHAARLFYSLEVLGHPHVAVLNGGGGRWRRARLPWTTAAPAPVAAVASYAPSPRRERLATGDWLRDRLGARDIAVVDARSPAEYAGRDVRARRGGHIPGAVNIEWTRHLRADGTLRPLDELRALYTSVGVTPDKTVVTYCQSHHRAAHSYFVLRLLGYPRVSGYDASWAEWGNRADVPVAR